MNNNERQAGCFDLFKMFLSVLIAWLILRTPSVNHESFSAVRFVAAVVSGLTTLLTSYALSSMLSRMVKNYSDLNLSLLASLDIILSTLISCVSFYLCGHFFL